MTAAVDFETFLRSKTDFGTGFGFEPIEIPAFLFPFQAHLADWAIRRGRAAAFADCGLGKTPIAFTWADNVVRQTNGRVLILTPLSVAGQYQREGAKFGFDAEVSRDGRFTKNIVITNYEKLHFFSPSDFDGVACDESSCIKNSDSKTKAAVVDFLRTIPYRLLLTATASPNDYTELGTSSEALGELGYQDMITKFFKQDEPNRYRGWKRTGYHLRGHAERDFWRWVCSWARACRKPSDLGFSDEGYELPELITREHVIESRVKRAGYLIDLPAASLQEQQEEGRRTLPERCEKAAELVHEHPGHSIAWCHLNPEGDRLEKLIPGSVQVSGADSDEAKEEAIAWFTGQDGNTESKRVLVSKPSMFGYGLNLQCCHHQTFFPSHSYEQWYQAMRRSYRFGQEHPVTIDMVSTEGQEGILKNLQSKASAAEAMFENLVRLMNDELRVDRDNLYPIELEVPSWL